MKGKTRKLDETDTAYVSNIEQVFSRAASTTCWLSRTNDVLRLGTAGTLALGLFLGRCEFLTGFASTGLHLF